MSIDNFREAVNSAKTQNVHLVHVTLKIGRTSTKIELRDTSIAKSERDWLLREGVGDPSIVMFPALKDAGYKIRKRLGTLRRKYTRTSARYWFLLDSDLPSFEKEFAELELELENEKQEILTNYDDFRSKYQTRIEEWFTSKTTAVRERFYRERQEAQTQHLGDNLDNLSEQKQKEVLAAAEQDFLQYLASSKEKYLSQFPTKVAIEEGFGLAIDEYAEISAFTQDANLAEESAKHRLHRRWEQTIFSHLGECLAKSTDDINKVVAQVLEELTAATPNNDTPQVKKKVAKTIDKLQSLVDFGASLREILYRIAGEKGKKGELLDFDSALSAINDSLEVTDAWFNEDRAILADKLAEMRQKFTTGEIPQKTEKPGTHRLGRFLRL